ncbi:hypothetical protein BGW42_005433 [Actinomortierella wolfii]|nr:hypothetical protein BGW42_005433 [Actinomortierella wolfii]
MSTDCQPASSTDCRARDEFILQHAPRYSVKQPAQEFFETFNLSVKKRALDALHTSLKATNNCELAELLKEDDFKEWVNRYFALTKDQKKLDIKDSVDKERTKLQTTDVVKGSEFIKLGMDLLGHEV